MRLCKSVLFSAFVVISVLVVNRSVLSNGGEFKETRYRGEIQMGGDSGKIVFSAVIDRVMFTLNSLESKYKVIRIQIENGSRSTFPLSLEKDEMEIILEDGKKVAGILNLRKDAPELWSAFKPELREMLAYPEVVTARPQGKGLHNVFLFIPDPKLDTLPAVFRYRIDSLDKVVEMKILLPPKL
jgi:hypothetical protein